MNLCNGPPSWLHRSYILLRSQISNINTSVIKITYDLSCISSNLTCGPKPKFEVNHSEPICCNGIWIRNEIYHQHCGLCHSSFTSFIEKIIKFYLQLSIFVCVLLFPSGMEDHPFILWIWLWAVWEGTWHRHPKASQRGWGRGHGAGFTHPLQSGQVSDCTVLVETIVPY